MFKVGDKVVVSKKFVKTFPTTTGRSQSCKIIKVVLADVYEVLFNSHVAMPTLYVREKDIIGYQKQNWFQKLFSR